MKIIKKNLTSAHSIFLKRKCVLKFKKNQLYYVRINFKNYQCQLHKVMTLIIINVSTTRF
jgi:hypothetical protein